jgi:CBS domain-containing protein
MKVNDRRDSAVLETVRSILERKGGEIRHILPDATVFEAIAEMAHWGIGALLVVADARLLGILTERDYARKVILLGRSSQQTSVSEIMTPSPITVTPETGVDECMRIMTDRRCRHLPVVENGELRGIISIGDLVNAIIQAQAYTIDQLHMYIRAGS